MIVIVPPMEMRQVRPDLRKSWQSSGARPGPCGWPECPSNARWCLGLATRAGRCHWIGKEKAAEQGTKPDMNGDLVYRL